MNDEILAERLIKNDEAALADIIDRFTPLVSTVIYNLSNGRLSQSDMEEATADTFIALWYNRKKVQKDKLKGFICCIAKNKARDRIKINGRHQTISIEGQDIDFEDEFVVSEKIENRIIVEALRQAIDEIGEPDREIIIRHYYYYQSSTEISEEMELNAQTVKSKISRTRDKLKNKLSERGFTK